MGHSGWGTFVLVLGVIACIPICIYTVVTDKQIDVAMNVFHNVSAVVSTDAIADMDFDFQGKPFLETFLAYEKDAKGPNREKLYTILLQNHMFEVLKVYNKIPPYGDELYDLMKYIQFDAGGCPRNTIFDTVATARLDGEVKCNRKKMIAFLISIHKRESLAYTRTFVNSLSDEDTAFFFIIDAKSGNFYDEVKNEFKDHDNVFFVQPRMNVAWGDPTQTYAMMCGIKVILESGIDFEWVSFHSGDDVLLRSKDDLKDFLRKKGTNNEFYEDKTDMKDNHLKRFWKLSPTYTKSCIRKKKRNKLANALLHLFPNWNANKYRMTESFGSQWWTLSTVTLKRLLEFWNTRDDLFMRLSFLRISDEGFMQLSLKKIGLNGRTRKDYLRWIDWEDGDIRIKERKFDEMMATDAIFARKMWDCPTLQEKITNYIEQDKKEQVFRKKYIDT